MLCIASHAHAQSDSSGRIEGVVFDSVHARPLADAHVVAVATDAQAEVRRNTTSDSAGRYHIDSLPVGRYVVGLESALLDSLEVTLSPREANPTAGRTATVDLALPSAARLRSAVCLGAALPPETGVVFGHVVSAESENPLAGVIVAMSWRDLGVDRKTLRPITGERSDSVVTDANGWYRMCGVPTGTWVSMQLRHQGRTGPVLRARVDDTLGIVVRHLSISDQEARAEASTSTDAARAEEADVVLLTGTAAVSGRILGSANEPVALAEVHVRGAVGTTRSDSTGWYSLKQLPAGTQILDVRRFGYQIAEVEVELRRGVMTSKDVRLQRFVATLDTMRSVASRYPEFLQHRDNSAYRGYYFGPEDLAKMRPVYTTDILQGVNGMRVEGRGPTAKVNARRRAGNFVCPPNIVVNGVEGGAMNDVSPKDMGAIEVYPPSDPPNLFSPWMYDKGCGSIVIWTKR